MDHPDQLFLSVTVVIPVLNEETGIERCLDAIFAQTYRGSVEVLVVDGGSSDATRELVARRGSHVRLLHNPRRIQAAALNIALGEARGAVIVRVDGHCVIAPDYVERCVDALVHTGAAVVGGAISPEGSGWLREGICAAMTSPFGAGPARFHVGGPPSWVDTVYLGAYRAEVARHVGGYREDVGVNEDAEFAIRMKPRGGIRFEPTIRSTYTPRADLHGVARQFFVYGQSRAATVRRHPGSAAPRQMVAPLLLASLATPWRKKALAGYACAVAFAGAHQLRRQPRAIPGLLLTLPTMHFPWAAGFWLGLLRGAPGNVSRLSAASAPSSPLVAAGETAAAV